MVLRNWWVKISSDCVKLKPAGDFMAEQLCEINSWYGVALAGFAMLEYFLGKTSLVEAGSTLEMILNFLRGLLPRK